MRAKLVVVLTCLATAVLCACQQSSSDTTPQLLSESDVKRFLDAADALANHPVFNDADADTEEASELGDDEQIDFLRPLQAQAKRWTVEERELVTQEARKAGFEDLTQWVDAGDAALCAATATAGELSFEEIEAHIVEQETRLKEASQDPALVADYKIRLRAYREQLSFCQSAAEQFGDSVGPYAPRIREFFGMEDASANAN